MNPYLYIGESTFLPTPSLPARGEGVNTSPASGGGWEGENKTEQAASIAPALPAEKPTKSLGFSIPTLEIFVRCKSQ